MLLSNRPASIVKSLIIVAVIFLCITIWYRPHAADFYEWTWDLNSLRTSSDATGPTIDTIPEKLWYKLGAKGLNDDCKTWIDTCLTNNPTYKHEFLNDSVADEYVKSNFAQRPDIVEAYLELQIPILKADMLRYLLLLREGGIYNDLDVSCEGIPIDEWIPAEYKKDAALVVGWEFDVGWGDNIIREFATWTMMARPGSPHLQMVVDDIIQGLHEKCRENNLEISGLTFDIIGDVVDLTGPRRLTSSILKSLELTLDEKIEIGSISNLLEPKLVRDVLILPGYSFADSSNTYPEGQGGVPLVTHHYAGTWKNEKGGEVS